MSTLVGITRAFIEQFRAGNGVLINVASMAAYQGNPNMAVYGAATVLSPSHPEASRQCREHRSTARLLVNTVAQRMPPADLVGSRRCRLLDEVVDLGHVPFGPFAQDCERFVEREAQRREPVVDPRRPARDRGSRLPGH